MERRDRLRVACALFVRDRTPARIRNILSHHRVSDTSWLESLDTDARDSAEELASALYEREMDVTWFGEDDYPESLVNMNSAPPVLFLYGNAALMDTPSVGMCGSRDVSEKGLDAARICGEAVASHGLSVVSGYAKGVDTQTHLAALSTGGNTVIVLAEGILGFRKKRVFNEVGLDPEHVLVVSQFAPSQKWNVGAAMTRNAVICGLGKALVVIEAGETGGTLNAGLQAIEMGKPVLALQFSEATPRGNEILFDKGAHPIRSAKHLSAVLDGISATPGPLQAQLFKP
jgi:DNA processing protein